MTVISANLPQLAPWWTRNAQLTNLSGRLLEIYLAHRGLILLCAGAMTVFGISHDDITQLMCQQGLIFLPHLATVGFSVGNTVQIIDTNSYLGIDTIHLISSAVFGVGRIYHSIRGKAVLPQDSTIVGSFGYDWENAKR